MSWINTPPWSHNVNLLPCIAAGVYYQGNGVIQNTTSVRGINNYLESINRPNRVRRITGSGCISQSNPFSAILSLLVEPILEDVGKTFRLFQDQIIVNNYSINVTSDNTFTILEDDVFDYNLTVNNLSKIANFSSTETLNIRVLICEEAHYLDQSKVVFDCSFTITKSPKLEVNSVLINNNIVTINFSQINTYNCTCSTTCLPVSGIGIICNNKTTSVQYRLNRNGLNIFNFNISDVNNNNQNIVIGILTNVTPKNPFVSAICLKEKQLAIIAGNRKSISYEDLKYYAKYMQVERFIESEESKSIFADWTDITKIDHIIDSTILPEKTYGYRIRYMGSYGDISNWSSWTIIDSKKNLLSLNIDDEVYY